MPLQIIDVLPPATRVRLRERMKDLTEQARARFRDTVVPIYGSKPNGRPVHIGSATLLDVNGHKILLTAAHIIDENQFTTLYVGAGKELELVSGQFRATPAPGGRDSDHYDFAFYEIPEELVATITGRFIALNEIVQSGRSEAGRLYTALGYPNSKNRKYNPSKLTVKPRLFPL